MYSPLGEGERHQPPEVVPQTTDESDLDEDFYNNVGMRSNHRPGTMGFKRDKEDFYKEYEKQVTVPIYDRLFHSQEGWDQRKHRDDAEYLPDIQINARHEDSFRTVPISDSAIYGKRDKHFYDLPDTSKRRVAVCTREFYSTNTVTTLPPLVGGDKLPNLPYQHREHNA